MAVRGDADAARVRALTAYKDFLALWKDADPDIPILKEAKADMRSRRDGNRSLVPGPHQLTTGPALLLTRMFCIPFL